MSADFSAEFAESGSLNLECAFDNAWSIMKINKITRVGFFAFAALASASTDVRAGGAADLVFRGGAIYTGNPDAPRVEALAVKDGAIAYLGTEAGLAPFLGRKTRQIELGARALYPGFTDAHARLYDEAWMTGLADLRGTRDFPEVVRRMARAVRDSPPNRWVLGWGWDQNEWADGLFPRAGVLQPVSMGRAICLFSRDGHAAVLNTQALALAAFNDETPDPPGGRLVRSRGNPTGCLIDRALDEVWKVLPDPTPAQVEARFRAGADSAAARGWTAAREMGIDDDRLKVLQAMAARGRKGRLPVRLYGVISAEALQDTSLLSVPPSKWSEEARIEVGGVRWRLDGLFTTRGAALADPYSDDAATSGNLAGAPEEFVTPIRRAAAAGWQPVLEASGERGVATALSALDSALAGMPADRRNGVRPTLERAVMIPADELERITRLGVTVTLMPGQLPGEIRWIENRLSQRRMKGVEEWRTLVDTQARVAFGTDTPAGPADPVQLFYHAVTRQDAAGRPAGGWYGDQKLTRAEALAALTSGAAMAGRRPEGAGTLERGRPADLTVLSEDIMSVPETRILSARPAFTVVGGEIVYERQN